MEDLLIVGWSLAPKRSEPGPHMKRMLAGIACCLCAAAGALAETPADNTAASQLQVDRFERQLEQLQTDLRLRVDQDIPVADRAVFDYGGYFSPSYLSLVDPKGETHALRQYDLVGYASVNLDGANEFFARGRAAFRDFNQGETFENGQNFRQRLTLERAYYRFDLARAVAAYGGQAVNYNVVVTAGRQLALWANGLTLDEEIDGATVSLSQGPLSLDLVAGVTPKDITDFDVSRPAFESDTERGFYGTMLSVKAGAQKLFAYALVQRDYNGNQPAIINGISTRFRYDSYYLGLGAAGPLSDELLYGVESAFEGGHGLSNSFLPPVAQPTPVSQSDDPIQAFALDARLDYLFHDARRSRLSAELVLASGDSDRLVTNSTFGGNKPGTTDNAFNGFGLLNTGLAFAPPASNLAMVRIGTSTFPLPDRSPFTQLQIGADLLVFNKLDRFGPIDEATNNSRYLGIEPDFFLTWPITTDLTLSVRYGVFFPGAAIEGFRGARNFVYTGLTYAF